MRVMDEKKTARDNRVHQAVREREQRRCSQSCGYHGLYEYGENNGIPLHARTEKARNCFLQRKENLGDSIAA